MHAGNVAIYDRSSTNWLDFTPEKALSHSKDTAPLYLRCMDQWNSTFSFTFQKFRYEYANICREQWLESGLSFGRSDYVMPCDDDDFISPNFRFDGSLDSYTFPILKSYYFRSLQIDDNICPTNGYIVSRKYLDLLSKEERYRVLQWHGLAKHILTPARIDKVQNFSLKTPASVVSIRQESSLEVRMSKFEDNLKYLLSEQKVSQYRPSLRKVFALLNNVTASRIQR